MMEDYSPRAPADAPPPERAGPGGAFWAVGAAALAAASYLLARYIHLGPPQGPWAYWPINGLLCGLLSRRPRSERPWIALTAATAQVVTIYLVRGNLAGGSTVGGAAMGAVQALAGAWLLQRQRSAGTPLGSLRELAAFVIGVVFLVPLALTPISALGFAYGLGLPFFQSWWPLFVGNSLSMLFFAPFAMQGWGRWREARALWPAGRLEVLLCQLCILVLSAASFGGLGRWLEYLALPYLMFPLLAWAALRSGPKWTALAILSVATVGAWCTSRGLGPFAVQDGGPQASVVGLQAYLAFVAFTALLLAALTEQHQRAFAELALQGAIQRAFFESSEPALALKDLGGHYLMLNRSMEELLGRPRERLLGRQLREVLSPADAALVEAHDQRVLERGQPLTFLESLGEGALHRQLLVTRFPVKDSAGTIRYVGMIGRDETTEVALGERLHRAQRVELLGQLAAGLAHDLNNLLSVLVNSVAVLQRRVALPREDAEILQDMAEAGERAASLTRRLMSFGRPEGSRAPLEVDEALRRLEPLLRALARGGIDVVGRYGAPGVSVVADASELEQIVLNLVSNARDAIAGEGRITVTTELALRPGAPDSGATDGAVSRWLQVRVEDNGEGMDPATLARLFQPFFTTKEGARGTGLGLYTTALLVRQLGGEIHATSTPGQGSTFVVGLPVAGPLLGS
ncbi:MULTISPECIES: ATP-binding protein [Myxococcaceae]|uniref:ATP-binding protein n=1 Tax=Myxococcaceae TaxID=31 RepID=UPI00188F3320|nr:MULTISPECIES: ATP-binding protein [Myxococcaceae]MBF5044983.1 MASE1 domain-containing protein [Simulacricoccus sp. 17bor-14]